MSENQPGRCIDVDGALLAEGERHLSALDRGFALGDGLFETIRVAGGRPFRLAAHLARLRAGAVVLRLRMDRRDDDLAAAVNRLLAVNELSEAVVRLTISRGKASERGLLPLAVCLPTVVIQTSPWRSPSVEQRDTGLCALVSAVRRNEHSPLSRIKSSNYLDNLLARFEAREGGADEAIMLNTAGFLACCSAANLFLVSGGRVMTPALECGVLAGITRGVVRELAVQHGLEWTEGQLRPSEMWVAEELFLTNSVLGVLAITRVNGREIGSGRPGQTTEWLAQQHEASLRNDA